ncbi:eCIS core domain-containing protein [Psychroflexus salis]|uniref:eCIS core domain-containing protein n=1 Tax=Psychroflexus salis TaxID=1526574 RepID=A0A917A221_9FLAO|nr:DUF4157 domain-containing protein [Psychroflexus salis]GGE21655.1 hypothetical protein GCM10010831_23410 [Psychroflexus salis]
METKFQTKKEKNNDFSISSVNQKNPFINHESKEKIRNNEDEANTVAKQLPNNIKTNAEHLSGIALDDVRVHYNSPEPEKLSSYAFAKGSNIHISSGQEQHLPHEAWHVVQQKQGRVKPILDNHINDDKALEDDAEKFGSELTKDINTDKNQDTDLMSVSQNDNVTQLMSWPFGSKKKEEKTDKSEDTGFFGGLMNKASGLAKDFIGEGGISNAISGIKDNFMSGSMGQAFEGFKNNGIDGLAGFDFKNGIGNLMGGNFSDISSGLFNGGFDFIKNKGMEMLGSSDFGSQLLNKGMQAKSAFDSAKEGDYSGAMSLGKEALSQSEMGKKVLSKGEGIYEKGMQAKSAFDSAKEGDYSGAMSLGKEALSQSEMGKKVLSKGEGIYEKGMQAKSAFDSAKEGDYSGAMSLGKEALSQSEMGKEVLSKGEGIYEKGMQAKSAFDSAKEGDYSGAMSLGKEALSQSEMGKEVLSKGENLADKTNNNEDLTELKKSAGNIAGSAMGGLSKKVIGGAGIPDLKGMGMNLLKSFF